jgi:hypothetical protein
MSVSQDFVLLIEPKVAKEDTSSEERLYIVWDTSIVHYSGFHHYTVHMSYGSIPNNRIML